MDNTIVDLFPRSSTTENDFPAGRTSLSRPYISTEDWAEAGIRIQKSFSTIGEWADVCGRMGAVSMAYWWIVGDCYNAGLKFGHGVIKRIMDAPGWPGPKYGPAANAGRIARIFPASSRYHELSHEYYATVASIKDPDERHALLAACVMNGWTIPQFRIEAHRLRANYHVNNGCHIAGSLNELIMQGRKYQVVFPDCPWPYENFGVRGGSGTHYKSMAIAELSKLPVADVCTDSTTLALWCTDAMLEEPFIIMHAWGFDYARCRLEWVKTGNFGCGYRGRVQTESILIGKRKNSPVWKFRPPQITEAPRGEHSAKPDVFYDIMTKALVGDYLEMFGRRERPGWTVCGDQIRRS